MLNHPFPQRLRRNVLTTTLVLSASSAFGLSHCPPNASTCGANPFYGFILVLAKHCEAVDPKYTERYQSVLKKMVAENPQAYAELRSRSEFQRAQAEAERKLKDTKPEELREACERFSKD